MFQKLVSHNDDLRRLVEKGYAVAFDSNCLIVRDIPYLDSELRLHNGTIVTHLSLIDETRVCQVDHQILFAGGIPHNLDGSPVPNLGGGTTQFKLSQACQDVVVERSFSNKPRATGKYRDFFEKIESYVAIMSGPAIELHAATPYTFRVVEVVAPDSIFKFQDTLTSKAGISELSQRFRDDVVAIVGLGGTAAYVLDFIVKTPVREIRAFDVDTFQVHNAYRSPGRLDVSELGDTKARVYQGRYENFRNGLSIVPKHIDESCEQDFEGVTFAFVCVDKGTSRGKIFDLLISKGIPFIDVGMGLNRSNGPLSGLVRTTYYSRELGAQMRSRGLAPLSDGQDDLYKANIQIAELNAINACLAVIKFKQLRGFYFEKVQSLNLLFDVGDLKVVSESEADES